MSTLLTATMHRLRPRLLLLQIVCTAILLLCVFFWLHIPDSHAWQLVLTFLLASSILFGIFCLYSHVIRALRQPESLCSKWLAMALLFGWAIVKWLLITLALLINIDADKRAGYWNSQLSHHMRTVFTYQRLGDWQRDLVTFLIWVLIPGLLLPLVIETVSRGIASNAWITALRVLKYWQHWLVIIAAAVVGCVFTHALVNWHPGHLVAVELISLVVRLTLAYLIDVLLIAFVFAFDSELLSRQSIR